MAYTSVLQIISALAFIAYGFQCIFSDFMKQEFNRFGVKQYRVLTGILEILGGLGLLVAYFWLPAGILASGGLSILMFMGIVTRVKVKDPLIQIIPAAILCVINAFLFYTFLSDVTL